jgi:HAMP domain-containing protein
MVNESRKRIAKLASTLETAAEIQTELNELAQAFNRTSPRTLKSVQNAA